MQWKALLASLGVVDPSDSKLITFDTENEKPRMPSTIAFQIPVSIQNLEGDGGWHAWFSVLYVECDQLRFGVVYGPKGG